MLPCLNVGNLYFFTVNYTCKVMRKNALLLWARITGKSFGCVRALSAIKLSSPALIGVQSHLRTECFWSLSETTVASGSIVYVWKANHQWILWFLCCLTIIVIQQYKSFQFSHGVQWWKCGRGILTLFDSLSSRATFTLCDRTRPCRCFKVRYFSVFMI